jgi:hypothetical protein
MWRTGTTRYAIFPKNFIILILSAKNHSTVFSRYCENIAAKYGTELRLYLKPPK